MIVRKLATTALVAVFLCLNSALADTQLKFGGLSFHTTSTPDNEFHRTMVLSHNNYFVGYVRNSFDDDSFVLGYSILDHQNSFDVAYHFGAIYGYRESTKCYKTEDKSAVNDDKRICPMIVPELILKSLPLKPSISYFGFDAVVFNLNYSF